ncbi:MAG: (Fe-S)-binding protein [Methanomassiliicoccales archaeon]
MVNLPEIDRELEACIQCGYCVPVCDTWNQYPWESVSPRGKVYYLRQMKHKSPMDLLLHREVGLDEEFVDALYQCTVCGACETVCHVGIRFVEFWEKVRKWVVEEGAGPMPAHRKFHERISKVMNPYGERPDERIDWAPEGARERADMIFFAGCTASFRTSEIALAGFKVLREAGLDIGLLGEDEWCCTSPTLRVGLTDLSYRAAENNITEVERRGARTMVTTCAGCYKTSLHDWPVYYARPSFDVRHFSQLAEELIDDGTLKPGRMDRRVTYHDPCHLGRHAGVFESPRKVIRSIPGIELVEMRRNRMNSQCCGAGGGYKSQYGDLAVNVAARRIEQALEAGADTVITCCPFCVVNLRQGAEQLGEDIEVRDLAEVLLESIS